MIEGVVLFFSPDDGAAHIWCAVSEVPLCVAYREDFRKLWCDLQIGSRVQLRARPVGKLMRAFELRLFAMETIGNSRPVIYAGKQHG